MYIRQLRGLMQNLKYTHTFSKNCVDEKVLSRCLNDYNYTKKSKNNGCTIQANYRFLKKTFSQQ